ncbi:pyrroloquinoline quinone biosynthesis protein PqqB [Cohnella panacarvi]|uniref:pyrroloquinoline quinone biosynthesis protein PqqB n=1 Tax=Cohnella panacarvi TaxID=400776 RepID=UPI00047D4179|nr:pyrroloquinoline quinone biosynthesis protein PqqB [Cohnella panacarvi]
MIIKVLGSAAGGGFPQWNCACPNCRRTRSGDPNVSARRNDSLAVSPDGIRWVLLNASPDIGVQLEAQACLHPGPSLRGTPIQAVLLTDAELDHTTGLLGLRQGTSIDIHAPSPVLQALADSFPIRRVIEPFASNRWIEVVPEESFHLFGGQLSVCPIDLGNKPPRYVRASPPLHPTRESKPWVVGYRMTDRKTGGVAVYAPGIESWSDTLARHAESADVLFLDGTFWHSDELRTLGASELDASDMGHLPIAGSNGSAERIARLSARRKVYVHINNTNPILVDHSPERRRLTAMGIEVGFDGMEMEV